MPLPLWGTVRLDADERLDKPDALALQNTNMEYVVRAIGAAFGWGGGCVTPPTVTFQTATSPRTLKLGGFQFYICEPILPESPAAVTPSFPTVYKGFRGNFLTFDPSDSGQITDIPFDAIWSIAQTSFANPPASMFPFLYVQSYAVDVDADARIIWDSGSGQGQPTTIRTRTLIRCAFKFSIKPPQEEIGWAPVLQVIWPDLNLLVGPGEPAVRYIGWQDTLVSQNFTGNGEAFVVGWPGSKTGITNVLEAKQSGSTDAVPDSDLFPAATPFADVGIIQTLQMIKSQRVKDMDVNETREWFQRQAGQDPAVARDTLTLFNRSDALWALPAVIAAGTVYYSGGTTYYFSSVPTGVVVGSLTRVSEGRVTIQIDPSLLSAYAVVTSNATLNGVSLGSPAEQITSWTYSLGGNTYIEVGMYIATGSGRADADFNFMVIGRRL